MDPTTKYPHSMLLKLAFASLLLIWSSCHALLHPVSVPQDDPCKETNVVTCHTTASPDFLSGLHRTKGRDGGLAPWTSSACNDLTCHSDTKTRSTDPTLDSVAWNDVDPTITEDAQPRNPDLIGPPEHFANLIPPQMLRRYKTITNSVVPTPEPPIRADSPTAQRCVSPNADIAGIGVRISIYAQTLLSFVPAFMSIRDGFLDSMEERLLHSIYTNLLLTACALLLSAFIQKATFGLSIYHAIIVLNLSWMVNVTSIIVCIFPTVHWRSKLSFFAWARRLLPAKTRQLPAVFLVNLHFCLMSGLGIWIWSNVDAPGNRLTPGMFTTVVFNDIGLTNKTLRVIAFALYTISAIPGVNIAIFAGVSYGPSLAVLAIWCKLGRAIIKPYGFKEFSYSYRGHYIAIVFIQFLINIHLIVDTELMINRSKGVPIVCVGTADSESNWTFGQTLAVAVIISPFCETLKSLLPEIRKTKWGRRIIKGGQWWLRKWLRRSERKWKVFYQGTTSTLSEARSAIEKYRKEPALYNLNEPILRALDTADMALKVAKEALEDSATTAAVATSSLNAAAPAASSATANHSPSAHRRLLCHHIYDWKTREEIKRSYDKIKGYVRTAHEDLTLAYRLRFKECDETPNLFFASRACLEATKAALDAVTASLEVVDCALELEEEEERLGDNGTQLQVPEQSNV